ncbi:MAG: hypothetical protein FWC46_06955, partial [Actinomycetia bacterium]|nr:hypothetical protein [Actinomycetes bacterium]
PIRCATPPLAAEAQLRRGISAASQDLDVDAPERAIPRGVGGRDGTDHQVDVGEVGQSHRARQAGQPVDPRRVGEHHAPARQELDIADDGETGIKPPACW